MSAVRAANGRAAEACWEALTRGSEAEWAAAPSTSAAEGEGACVAVPSAMPAAWPESEYWCGTEAGEAARAELRYISRRRAEAQKEDVLARERMSVPTQPPRLQARPVRIDQSWPEGAPPAPITIDRLFNPGVYQRIQRALAKMSSKLRTAEQRAARGDPDKLVPGCLPEVYEAFSCQPERARARVWDARDPSNCVPVRPFSREDPPAHDLSPRFFEEWGERLQWPDKDMLWRAMWEGGSSRSACRNDTVIHTHHLGLREHHSVARTSVDARTRLRGGSQRVPSPPVGALEAGS